MTAGHFLTLGSGCRSMCSWCSLSPSFPRLANRAGVLASWCTIGSTSLPNVSKTRGVGVPPSHRLGDGARLGHVWPWPKTSHGLSKNALRMNSEQNYAL
eukprot:4248455-Amphidinium_carterae.4